MRCGPTRWRFPIREPSGSDGPRRLRRTRSHTPESRFCDSLKPPRRRASPRTSSSVQTFRDESGASRSDPLRSSLSLAWAWTFRIRDRDYPLQDSCARRIPDLQNCVLGVVVALRSLPVVRDELMIDFVRFRSAKTELVLFEEIGEPVAIDELDRLRNVFSGGVTGGIREVASRKEDALFGTCPDSNVRPSLQS